MFTFNEIYKSLQTSCLPYKCFPQDYLKIKKGNFKRAIWQKTKNKQVDNNRSALSCSGHTSSDHTRIPRPPTHFFPHLSSYSRDTLKLWARETPPALSPCWHLISRLMSYLCLAQPLIKSPNYPVPLHSDLHPFLVRQHQVDVQSILLINAGSFLACATCPFLLLGIPLQVPASPEAIHSTPLLALIWNWTAKISLRQ